MTPKHPLILWAQRSPHIYLSVELDDFKVDTLTVDEDSFQIRGTRGTEIYQADLKLFGKLKGSERRQINTDRRVELIIPKQTVEWWPRLLEQKSKVAWVKVDFDKWIDEDEENESEDPFGDLNGGDFSGFPGGANFPMDLGGGAGFDENDDNDMGELEDMESNEESEKNQNVTHTK